MPFVKSLPRYSIRAALVVMFLVALGIAAWKAFIWEPPTHKISQYEKAPIFYGTTATIGPNQIRILSVARNDRDGGLRIENGRGLKIDAKVPNQKVLADCGGWLDAAQIDLAPGSDLVDIIEIRIFDHKTRELLHLAHPRCGFRLVKPNVIQLYGLGAGLPKQIDLWLRVHSYDADDPVYKLPPKKGASVKWQAGSGTTTVTINEIQKGYQGWSSADGFFPVGGQYHADCAIEVGWDGSNEILKYQVAAVTKEGNKLLDSRFLSYVSTGKSPVEFHCPLDQVDHIEMRPFGGGHRFFFDGLTLPSTVGTAKTRFDDPPTVAIQVGGKLSVSTPLAEFAPLDIRLMLADGLLFRGSTAGQNYLQLLPHPMGPKQLGEGFTRVLQSRGLSDPPYAFRIRSVGSNVWTADNSIPSRGGFRASTSSRGMMATAFLVPIKDIDAIEVKLLPIP